MTCSLRSTRSHAIRASPGVWKILTLVNLLNSGSALYSKALP